MAQPADLVTVAAEVALPHVQKLRLPTSAPVIAASAVAAAAVGPDCVAAVPVACVPALVPAVIEAAVAVAVVVAVETVRAVLVQCQVAMQTQAAQSCTLQRGTLLAFGWTCWHAHRLGCAVSDVRQDWQMCAGMQLQIPAVMQQACYHTHQCTCAAPAAPCIQLSIPQDSITG